MKNLLIFYSTIFFSSASIFLILSQPVLAQLNTGQIEHKSVQLNKSGNIVVKGIDLSPYHFERIYSYALISQEYMIVMGSKADDVELIAISLPDKRSVIVEKYPYLRWSLRTANFTAFTMQKLTSSNIFIILKYRAGNIARRIDETSTIIDIYHSESYGRFKLINRQKVSTSNITYNIQTDIKYKYRHLEVDNSTTGMDPLGPAKRVVPMYFINDVNNDGFSDILIWKAFYLSRRIEEDDKKAFILEREELHVMYFNYLNSTFTKPIALK